MKHIEPKFERPHPSDSPKMAQSSHSMGHQRSNFSAVSHMSNDAVSVVHSSNAVIDQRMNLKHKKHGSDLGWGWFQLFSLFVTGLLLTAVLAILWMMVGDESVQAGPPKYVLSKEGTLGDIDFNPQLPASMIANNVKEIKQNSGKNEQVLLDPLKAEEKSQAANTELNRVETTPLNAKTDQQQQTEDVEQLLVSGAQALRNMKLTTPENDSAYYYYTQVLMVAPENASAKAGILEIVKRYADLVQRDLDRGNVSSAKKYLAIGLKLDPQNNKLLEFKQEVESYVDSADTLR